MRTGIAILAALLVAGCGGSGLEAASRQAQGPIVVGTIAPIGSFEWQAAPAYTRLVLVRLMAARKVSRGEISVEAAREVQAQADNIRQVLDNARASAERGQEGAALRDLEVARQWLEDLDVFMERGGV